LALLVVAILTLAGPADAQVIYGSMVGNVSDTSAAAVPGAAVTAIHEQTNLARETTTGGQGGYSFQNLQEGTYTVRVSLQGFKEFVEENVPVTPNRTSRVDITLEVGALSETITVQSERTLLQTDAGDLQAVIESEEITALPMGNYRNYQTLLNLVPGTTPGRFQNAITDTPERSLSNNINGTNRNNNNAKLDGATNIFVWLPHHAAYVAPAETVDTVNVSTASFDAEQGMSGGAAISVMTKSGTNEFRGSGTYLFENQNLRARNFFNSGEKPDSKRQIGAVTLGGPIIKDKLFFFGGWEGHYLTGQTTRTGTLATAAMRAGDFSGFDTVIYDPLTGNPDGTGRQPFPGNIIPADRIHPASQLINDRTPLPNRAGTTSNHNDTGPFTMDRNNYDFKVNWNVSNSLMIWGKYSHMDAFVNSEMWLGNPDQGGIGGSGWGVGSGFGDTVVKIPTVGFTWTASPTFVVDGVVAAMYFDQKTNPPDFGVNYGLDVFNIPGTNGASGGIDDIRYSGLPEFNISGFTDLGGNDGWNPSFRNDTTKNVSVNATWIKGNHEVRFGGEVMRMTLTHWQPEIGNPRGQFIFGGQVTALNGGPSPNNINAYAQFLLGLASEAGKSIQYDLLTGREWRYGFFVRDRWQVNRNLTLTLGLRWELFPMMKREDRGIEEYDPSTNIVTLCGKGGVPDDCGLDISQPGILPRIGFAYRLGENNVIRGGFGRTVDPLNLSRPLRGFYPISIANNFEPLNSFGSGANFTDGLPIFTGPDRSLNEVPLPLGTRMRSPMESFTRGYIDSWNLIYERRLPWDMSLSTGYVGTRQVDQLHYRDINASFAGGGTAGRPLFEPFGQTARIRRFGEEGLKSNYHSLQVALNKPFARGLFLKGAYTWSKAMNRTDDAGGALSWNDPAALFKNYSLAGYDRTHLLQLGFVWEMPFGRDSDGALAAIIKDWSMNGIFSAMSGTPFTVSSSGASVNSPGNSQSADQVGEIDKLGGIGRGNPYYDRSAWAPVTEVRYGNTGRNSVRGPGLWNIDLGLFRRFPIGDRVNLELRAEAFNLTNTPKFGNPNGSVTSGNFMYITNASFGGTGSERQFRLGARISF
jgi:hypothetical protein